VGGGWVEQTQASEKPLYYLLTFNVPVDNHIAVQVEDSLQDLPGVLPCDVLGQSTVSF